MGLDLDSSCRKGGGIVTKHAPDPTPEEIRRQCEAIRAAWSRKQEQQRLAAKPEQWELPEYNVMEISPSMGKLVGALDKTDHMKED
jgi:hypothetical protein